MAQQRRQYEGAMESIFDFIFEQNERPPHKRTPLKVTGVDGTSEVVEALGAVLEKPGAFVNDATMDGLIEFANIDLAKISLGDRLPGAVKFNLKDIGTILKDPSAYVEKSFKTMEAIRRSQRIAHSGEIMGSLVAKGWAKRHGLGKEVGDAMMNIGRPQAFRGKMNVRALKLMEEYFKEEDEAAKKELIAIKKRPPKTIGLPYLTKRYGKGKAEMLYGKYKGVKEVWENWKKAEGRGDLEAAKKHRDSLLGLIQDSKFPEFYAMLESREIRRLITKVTDREEKLNYVRAADYIDNMAVIQANPFLEKQKRTLFIENTKQTIESREKIIEQLKRSGAPTSEIAKHRQAIKDLKSDLRDIKNYEFAGRLGEWEGMYYSAKTMFTEGNLLPFMINGKFFDPNHNQIKWLQPAAKGKMYIGKDKKGKKLGELEFVAPKKTGNRYSDNYNAGMTSLYYFSPVTWAKTLYTGEGFAYMAYLSQEKMSKMLLKEITKDLPFEVGDFFEAIANGDVDLFMADLQSIMSTEAFEKIERLTSKLGKQYKLAHRFSAYSRFKANIQKNFDEKIGKNLREFVGNKILLKLGFVLKDEIAKVAVEAWMESGGLYGMIRTVITAGLNAIGIPGLVADALAWVATKVVVKIAKPVVKFGAEFLKYGLVGCFGMALFIVVIVGSAIFGVHSHIAPGTCEDCEEWATYAEEYKYGLGEDREGCGVSPIFSSNPTCCIKNTLNIPPSLVYAIEEAGNAYDVPPALILAVIYGEGYLNPGSDFYDESFVAEHIKSCAQIPGCNPDGPEIIFNIYKKWWDADAVKVFDPNREPYPCNILDGLFSVAKALSRGKYGSEYFENPITGSPYTCFGVSLNVLKSPSVSCDDWTNSDIITAIRRWQFGYEYDHNTLSCATKENSCLLGGGLAAQCPTGGDTCETINKPLSGGRSHTGCLWDIYQENKGGACIERVNSYGGSTQWTDEIPKEIEPLPSYVQPSDQTKRECPFSPETIYPMRCTQGPDGTYSHQGLNAIDIAGSSPGSRFHFHAPKFCDKSKKNCTVKEVGRYTYMKAEVLVDCGGRVMIEVSDTGGFQLQIDILHVTYGVTKGQVLDSYEPVAYITHSKAWENCSTAEHAHVEIKKRGGAGFRSENPYTVLTSDPFNCNITSCP